MLTGTQKEREPVDVETSIALDECGGHVMLSLKAGGNKFCQALSAHDMGLILAICDQYKEAVVCCEGDLEVYNEMVDHQVVHFRWIDDGRRADLALETTDMFVFEWACRSYCRQLMRTNKGA